MSYGDIVSIDELQFDDDTNYATLIKITSGIVAVFWTHNSDGYVATYAVDEDGNIGAQIDSWVWNSIQAIGGHWRPWAVHISGTIYGVFYRYPPTERFYCMTFRIANDGTITKSSISNTLLDTPGVNHLVSGAFKKSGTNTFITLYSKSGTPYTGKVLSVHIDDDGTNITVLDTWDFGGGRCEQPVMIQVTGDVFALVYNDGSNSVLKTFQISDAGIITESFIDTETVGSDTGFEGQIELVADDVYAIFTVNSSVVRTYQIESDGEITALDSGNFYTKSFVQARAFNFGRVANDVYFIVTGQNSWDGFIVTLTIDTSGNIGSLIDAEEFESNNCQYVYNWVEIQPEIYLGCWASTPGVNGHLVTLGVETPPEYEPDRIYVWLGTLANPKIHELTDPEEPYVLAARTEVGRDEETVQASAGIAEIICDNFNGDFNPENASGAFYGDLDLDKTIYVYEIYLGVTYEHFLGKIRKIIPHGELDYPYAHILAVDGMDDLAEKEIRTVLRTDTETGELGDDILDAVDWPAGDRNLDTGIDTLQLGWFHKVKALDAWRTLEKHEDGFFYVKIGVATWENRHHRVTGDCLVSQHDFEDTAVELPYEYSKRYYFNQVTVRGKRYYADGATLWSGYDMAEIEEALIFSAHAGDVGAPYIPQGLTVTFWAEFGSPLHSYDTLVKGTHWNANSEPDKTGIDLSDNISISETQYGQAIKLEISNSGGQGAYLVVPDSPPLGAPDNRTLLIYGVLYAEEVMSMTVEDVPSGSNIREMEVEAPFMSNPNDVLAHAQYLHGKYGTPRPRAVSVRHVARTAWPDDTIRIQCLERAISDRITVKSTRLNFDKDFYINKIIQDYVFQEAGVRHETTWIIEAAEGTAEQVFWLLGVTNFGELGIATRLGR